MNSTQKSTPQIMHYAFKTWCIVSTSGRYAIKVPKTVGFRNFLFYFVQKSYDYNRPKSPDPNPDPKAERGEEVRKLANHSTPLNSTAPPLSSAPLFFVFCDAILRELGYPAADLGCTTPFSSHCTLCQAAASLFQDRHGSGDAVQLLRIPNDQVRRHPVKNLLQM